MALIICPDCSKEFSDLAQNCPNCARPNVVPAPHVSVTGSDNFGVGFILYLVLLLVGIFLWRLFEPGSLIKVFGALLAGSGGLGLTITTCKVLYKLLQKV